MTDLVVDDAVKAGMDAVRNGSNDWILLGFATPDDSTKLVVLGTGTGGVEAMAGAVPASDVGYGVVKRDFVLDEAQGMGKTKVLKFLRVTWRPEAKLSLKRKMKMGTLDGQIKKVLGSTHADLEFDDPSQMVDKVVVDLIERITQKADMVSAAAGKEVSSFFNSGTAVQARTAAGDKAAAARKHDAFMDPSHLTGQAKGAEFEWQDLDAIKAAIARVRDDADPTTWMTAGYVDKKTIALFDTGAGADPVPEVTASFRDATLCFGLFRVTERIDKTTAVRFVFVTWQPEDIPVMARASQATHRGGVVPVFRPFHVDFSISSRSELTLDGVMDTIMKQSGTKSMVTDAKPAHKEEVYVRKMLGGVKEEIVPVDFVDKDALEQAVKAVRSDADPTAWVVATYAQKDGKNLAVQLKASGAGGVPEFAAALCDEPDNTAYGLVRVQQTIDDRTSAVKFVFVTYQGSAMASMFKAKVSTLRGAILPVFTPYHAEMFVDSAGEVTDASVQERLR